MIVRFCRTLALVTVVATSHAFELRDTDGRTCGVYLADAEGKLPISKDGYCGEGLAICPVNQCCDQNGRCRETGDCGNTCQCEFSGQKSDCDGSPALVNVPIPIAPHNGICGPGVASCPEGECCGLSGFCSIEACSSRYCREGQSHHQREGDTVCTYPGLTSNGTRFYELEYSWIEAAPDGFARPVIATNGGFPGPDLRCKLGERLIVKVHNRLNESLSVHWHGFLQHGALIMDGVGGITQRGLAPGASAIYDMVCATAGSYWWHSHYKAQYVDGLRGSLFVEDPYLDKRYKSDPVVQFTDWYHQLTNTLIDQYLTPEADGAEPVPVSALINGVGCYPESDGKTHDCKYSIVPAASGATAKKATTRLNLISTAGFARFRISVDGHKMRVVAIDGLQTKRSSPVRIIQINVGQRMSVELVPDRKSSTKAGEVYWIRGYMEQSVFDSDSPNPLVLAILEYNEKGGNKLSVSNDKTRLPKSSAANITDPKDILTDDNVPEGASYMYDLEVAAGSDFVRQTPPKPTRILPIEINFYDEPSPIVSETINWAHFSVMGPNISMQLPNDGGAGPKSLLEHIYDGAIPPNENFGYNTVQLESGDVVELRISNFDDGQHPLHLHGHWMWVMARGETDAGPYKEGTPVDSSPILRDTVTVNGNSYIVVRFIADNPGIWVFHCHIDWHVIAGLMLAFEYGLGV